MKTYKIRRCENEIIKREPLTLDDKHINRVMAMFMLIMFFSIIAYAVTALIYGLLLGIQISKCNQLIFAIIMMVLAWASNLRIGCIENVFEENKKYPSFKIWGAKVITDD